MMAARAAVASEALGPKPRASLRGLIAAFDRWRGLRDAVSHTELAEIVLDESGYTEMWQNDRSADAAGRLENLKELVRSMEEFENLQGFLEHIALVMDTDKSGAIDAVSIMTLHSAKGLEFETVFLPGWEEGLLPHQRSLDEQGRGGLEEERRLAHVGLTRARRRAKIYFVANRRMRGSWTATLPSRFIDELPEAHIGIEEPKGGFGGFAGYGNVGGSRFDRMDTFGSSYRTPGWQRARGRSSAFAGDEDTQAPPEESAGRRGEILRGRWNGGSPRDAGRIAPGRFGAGAPYAPASSTTDPSRMPMREAARLRATIEGELVAKSTGTASPFAVGDRVFHQKFGNGNVVHVEGNKLTIAFDRAGEKKVVDSFIARV
jgi:DNA helicase-2/ATP-dependent DNA helicase PcrA